MMLSENVIPDVYAALGEQNNPRDTAFYRPAHQIIYTAILAVFDRGETPDAALVGNQLQTRGHLNRTGGAPYLLGLIEHVPTVTNAAKYAQIVLERHADRGILALATRLHQAATEGHHDTARELVEHWLDTQHHATHDPGPTESLITWGDLLTADFGDVDYLAGRLMARGQQIALVGNGKVGKSVLAQEWLWRMSAGLPFLGDRARDPVRVLYVDAENGHADLQDRFISFGATPDSLTNLVYASFPALPPLDTPAGGTALLQFVQHVGAQVVTLDTASRFISGPENDSDTWLALYRCTLRLLKAEGIASIRLDHFGKDTARGARGSSAKTQDVDQVWELTETGGGLYSLKRTHTRTGLGPAVFTIRRLGEKENGRWKPGGTRHVLPTGNLFHGVDLDDLIAHINATGLPARAGRDKVRAACIENGIDLPGNDVLAEAIRQRKARANRPVQQDQDRSDLGEQRTVPGWRSGTQDSSGGPEDTEHADQGDRPAGTTANPPEMPGSSRKNCPGQFGDPRTEKTVQQDQDSSGETPGQTCPGQFPNTPGQAMAGPVLSSLPLEGGQVGQPRPAPTACTSCGSRLDPAFAAESTLCTICAVKENRRDQPA